MKHKQAVQRYNRAYRLKHPEAIQRAWRKQALKQLPLRFERKRKAVEYKGGQCSVCGYKKSMYALDFHHTNPDLKRYSLAKMLYSHSWKDIQEELDKCILICSNCHRELHGGTKA